MVDVKVIEGAALILVLGTFVSLAGEICHMESLAILNTIAKVAGKVG